MINEGRERGTERDGHRGQEGRKRMTLGKNHAGRCWTARG